MPQLKRPRILVVSNDFVRARELLAHLDGTAIDVECVSFREMHNATEYVARSNLTLLLGPCGSDHEVEVLCGSVNAARDGRFIPLLVIDECRDTHWRARFEAGCDIQLATPVEPKQIARHIESLLRIQAQCDAYRESANATARENRRLRKFSDQIDQELSLAGKIQQSFLPRSLPEVGAVRFAVKYATSSPVGGDFYDVLRLDERTIGGYVADAMGHGVPASLLTVYVKKGVVVKEIFKNGYRLLGPQEVLERLNNDLLAQELSENPFITMVYFTLDVERLVLSCSRAGHPYPFVISANGRIATLEPDGMMLGVFESTFEVVEKALVPGDRVLFYTDGVDGVRYGSARQGADSLCACVADLHACPITELIDGVYDALFPDRQHDDDLTLLGFEIAR